MPKVLIPLAQGCEELEAVTIVDLLRRANIDVITAGLDEKPVTCSRKTVILPDTLLEEVLEEEFDMIVLPGGLPGADYLDQDARIQTLLKKMATAGKYVAAICAAPKVLGSAGLLNHKRATAYPGVLEKLGLSDVTLDNAPVVMDGNVITSKGPGTAMDFTLTLIEILVGKELRDKVESALQRP